jgi:hypothetical protein
MTYYPPATGMPDPVVLSTLTPELIGIVDASNNSGSSGAWPTALKAMFYPVRLSQPRTYVKAWWVNGATAAGNVDVGIYTLSGTTLTRVAASTAEAQGTISTLQVAATFPTTTIGPGLYYLAMSCSLATATVLRTTAGAAAFLRVAGAFQALTSHPLPTTATSVAISSNYLPLFGFSEQAAI